MAAVDVDHLQRGKISRAKATPRFLVVASPAEWTISTGATPFVVPFSSGPTDLPAFADAVSEALRAAGHAGEPVLLALAWQLCFATSLAIENLPRRGRRNAMLYRLEEQLPLAAEDVVADFIVHAGQALAVAALAADLAAIVELLAARGIAVVAIAPKSFLAYQELMRHDSARLFAADAVVWQHDRRIELFILSDSNPVRWFSLPADSCDVSLAMISSFGANRAVLQLSAIDLEEPLQRSLAELAEVNVCGQLAMSFDEAVGFAADRILAGHDEPLFNLRRDGSSVYGHRQIRSSIVAVAIGVLVLFLTTVGSLLIRARQYASIAQRADERQVAVFHQLFPQLQTPESIESRLRAVRQQLAGHAATGGSAKSGPNAFAALQDLLQNLPKGIRYRITDIDLDGQRLTLQGEATSLESADAVANALRNSHRFIIDVPQAQQVDGNITAFTLSGVANVPGTVARREP